MKVKPNTKLYMTGTRAVAFDPVVHDDNQRAKDFPDFVLVYPGQSGYEQARYELAIGTFIKDDEQ